MMKARPYALRMVAPRRQRRLVSLFLVLVGSLLCFVPPSDAKNDYEIINTGIKGGGCWYDDSHFIVVKGQQPAPGQEFEVEGLYYLNPNRPKDLKRIDLAPLEPSQQKHIRDVTCQDETILFHILPAHRSGNRLYTLKIGQTPVLLAEKAKGFVVPRVVNIKNQYVLGFSSVLKERGLESSATPEKAKTDCPFSYLRPPLEVVCLRHDRGIKQTWLANNRLVVKYIWDETIRVSEDGQYKWAPNPEPPLKRADGIAVKLGFFLRDLNNRIAGEIPRQQDDYQYDTIHLKIEPVGRYLYCPCWKAGDHGEKRYTAGGRICRFRLDGLNQRWEEVVSVQQSPRDPFSLQDLNVNSQGDVVMIERGHRLLATLLMYHAQSERVDKLLQVRFPDELGGPQVSPNGQWVLVGRQGGQLVLIERKGLRS